VAANLTTKGDAIMNKQLRRRSRLGGLCATGLALILVAGSATAVASSADTSPIVGVQGGNVQGFSTSWGFAFRGIPYAAPPTGSLRWRPPQQVRSWSGIRNATHFAPSCPQSPTGNATFPPGRQSENCLYLNIFTPSLDADANRPVFVWIHGGGLTQDAGRNYNGAMLTRRGLVVVTINYRLGALGFLAHPALAARDGSTGNYGLMDQQAALRWVRQNIARFGGNPHNVTIAGQSAGGLSVLAQMVSRGARGLFQRAIVQSGAFALHQQSLAQAEAAGEAFAAQAGCPNQTARCLRHLPVSALVTPASGIPGTVDGKVLTEPIATALQQGHFSHVPVLNGVTHNEEWIFVAGLGVAVSNGRFVQVPPVTADNYVSTIAAVAGVSQARAQAIADQYPVAAYGGAAVLALSTLLSDANFACPALQVDRWTSPRVPTFGYQFNDDNAPQRYSRPGVLPPIATHSSEIPYLLAQPNLPFPGAPFTAGQRSLAKHMQVAWAQFAARGNPSTASLPWPSIGADTPMLSLVPPVPTEFGDYEAQHHCGFWAAG
jgi:para-nitrobenzyl esterase